MKKQAFIFSVLLIVLLAGCGQKTAPVQELPPTETLAPVGEIPTAPIPTSGPAFCVAQTGVFPTPDPTSQAAYPPPTEEDRVLGDPTAALTIIEYSDYQ